MNARCCCLRRTDRPATWIAPDVAQAPKVALTSHHCQPSGLHHDHIQHHTNPPKHFTIYQTTPEKNPTNLAQNLPKMSGAAQGNASATKAVTSDSKDTSEPLQPQKPGAQLEEDDEFEDFPVEGTHTYCPHNSHTSSLHNSLSLLAMSQPQRAPHPPIPPQSLR